MKKTILPVNNLSREITIPASKSHTIRALLIAAMADKGSLIINPLDSADTRSCVDAVRIIGAKVKIKDDRWIVKGTGGKVIFSDNIIDVGNSGTTLALAAGLAALGTEAVTFTGDDQIKSRPVGNLLNSLIDLGAKVTLKGKDGCPPFTITGPLTGGKTATSSPAASTWARSAKLWLMETTT